MIRTFVETQVFKQMIDQQSDKDLEKRIKQELLKNPQVGDIIQGTGGLRKFRLADKNRHVGKSGGYRIIYLDVPSKEITYLFLIYGKNMKDDLSPEKKRKLSKLVEELKHEKK